MNLLPPPGPARTRQLIALSVAVLALFGTTWYMFGSPSGSPSPRPPTTASAATSNPPKATASPKPAGPGGLPAPLKLDALGGSGAPDTDSMTRNPFRFGQPPPPPAPKYVPPPPTLPPPPPGPPPVPDIPLQLVLLETLPGDVRTATMRDTANDALLSGTEGQVLDGRFRLVKIGLESVVVSYLDGSGRKTLPLAR